MAQDSTDLATHSTGTQVGEKLTAPKAKPTPAQRLTADLRANNAARSFLDRYQGAVLRCKLRLGNRVVVRLFSRGYAISVRNWHIATTVPRVTLGDHAMSQAVEVAMLGKLSSTRKSLESLASQTEVLMQQIESPAELSHPDEFRDDQCPVLGPVAMQLFRLYVLADKLVDNYAILYAYGVMSQDQHSTSMLELKRELEGATASIRHQRFMTLSAVNKQGMAREGFTPIPQDSEIALDAMAPVALQPALAAAAAVIAAEPDERGPEVVGESIAATA